MATFRKDIKFDFAGIAKQLGYINDPILAGPFQRPTSATRINPLTGAVEAVAANIMRACGRQELWKAGCKNLFSYSADFVSEWHYSPTVTAVNISTSFILTPTASWYIYKYITTPVAQTTFSIRARSVAGTQPVNFRVYRAGSETLIGGTVINLTSAYQVFQFTVTPDQTNCLMQLDGGNNGQFELEWIQSELGSVATDYEPNPVVIQPGAMLEGQATNLSSVFGADYWGFAGCTITGTTTAPDGTQTAKKVSFVPGSYVYKSVAAPDSLGGAVFSIWLRSVSGSPVGIELGSTAAIIKPTSEWRRYYIYANNSNGTLALNAASGTYELEVWGADYKAGTFPSSYIPTSGAAATRAKDVPLVDVSKIWNPQEGTIIVEADSSSAADRQLLSGGNSGNTSTTYLDWYGNGTLSLSVANNGTWTYYPSPGTAKGRMRLAISYANGSLAMSLNGGAAVRTAGNTPDLVSLALGMRFFDAAMQINGTLQSFIYVPYAADDATLKALSRLS